MLKSEVTDFSTKQKYEISYFVPPDGLEADEIVTFDEPPILVILKL